MYRNVFLKTLNDIRHATLFVSVGLFAMGLYVSVLFPEIGTGFADMIEDLPEFLKSILGEAAEFATPEGYFSAQPFGVVGPVTMIAFGINRGMSAIAGEEEGNTLDQLLGNPITRSSLMIQKALALIVTLIPPAIFLGSSLIIGSLVMNFSFSTSGMLQMLFSLLMLGYSMGFLALGIGAATGSKSLAIAVPAVVAAVGYIINLLAPLSDSLSFTQYISVVHYYIGDRPFINGITPWHTLVLFGIATLSFAIGLYRFNRRDLH